jgi:hypothetical protein
MAAYNIEPVGSEAKCAVEYDGSRAEAKVQLETEELIVRSPFRVTIPFREMRAVEADGERLTFRFGSQTVALHLGPAARKWAEKIRNPKSLADKLGISDGQKISITGSLPPSFVADLEKRGADVSARVRQNSDIIFFAVETSEGLERISRICKSLAPDGALWIIRPKGSSSISERDVMAAGKAAGLVDVKVANFSPTHTAEKFVIPVAKRTTRRNRG